MRLRDASLRQIKYALAPIVVLPLLLTLITGVLYQIADLAGKQEQFKWLLSLHKGSFGSVHLSAIYPFFNALGLLIMTVAGILLWYRGRKKHQQGDKNRRSAS